MTLAAVSVSQDGHIAVSGVLSFDTVADLRAEGDALIKNLTATEALVVDFQAVKQSDSSALALLTAWARSAGKLNKTIKFVNLQAHLIEIAKLSNLDKIINYSGCV